MRLQIAIFTGAVALVGSTAQATAATTYTVRPTTACLTAHRVLSSRLPLASALPPGTTAVAAISFSFALIPAQVLDNGLIVFARSPTAAQKVAAAWIAYAIAQASHVQGIDQAKARARIRNSVSTKANAVVIWNDATPKAASRQRVATCLR
jgi:hypothetical protein